MTDIVEHVDGLLHEPTQVHDGAVDLTVAEVSRVVDAGRVDFGGGELDPAGTEPVERHWRAEDDDYQWWHLTEGQYLLSYNESLSGEAAFRLEPRDALCDRGASHPTLTVTDLDTVPLAVPSGGLYVKENARVSTLREL